MKRSLTTTACLSAALALAPALVPAQQHAHVHGSLRLGVALQGDSVTIELEAPLDSLLGFEHAPRTAAQKQAASSLLAKLRQPRELFRLDTSAQCEPTEQQIDAPALQPAPAGSKSAEPEHADIDAGYGFKCRQPQALRQLELALFEAFPRLQRIEAEVATERDQFKRTLKRGARVLPLVAER